MSASDISNVLHEGVTVARGVGALRVLPDFTRKVMAEAQALVSNSGTSASHQETPAGANGGETTRRCRAEIRWRGSRGNLGDRWIQ